MKFEGLLYLPTGIKRDQLRIREVPLTTAMADDVRKFFRESIRKESGFTDEVAFGGYGDDPIKLVFQPAGKTAASFLLGRESQGVKIVDCATALLTKLDAEEDRQAIEAFRHFDWFKSIPLDSFEKPLANPTACHATYFSSLEAVNSPALHTINRLLTMVFFSQFGVGLDE